MARPMEQLTAVGPKRRPLLIFGDLKIVIYFSTSDSGSWKCQRLTIERSRLPTLQLHMRLNRWLIWNDLGYWRTNRYSRLLNMLIKPRNGLIESLLLCKLLTWFAQVAPNRKAVNNIGVQVDLPRHVLLEENVFGLPALLGRKDLVGFCMPRRSAAGQRNNHWRDTNRQQQY